jgi:ribosome-associated toxin RatA of RatAB toxin-antitoxin module
MAERTTSSIEIDADPTSVMAVIADLEAYPVWTGSVREVEVLAREPQGSRPTTARFILDAGAIKDTYVLEYTWDGDRHVRWSLVEGEILTSMEGAYTLSSVAETKTSVEYELTLDLKIPMIGLLRRRAEKVVTDTALKELRRRVEG